MRDLLSIREWLAVMGTSLLVAAGIAALTTNTTAAVSVAVVSLGVPVILMCPAAVLNTWSRLRDLRYQLRFWHLCWILMFCSGFVFRTRDADSIRESPLDLWAVYRVALVAIVLAIILARTGLTPIVDSLRKGALGWLTIYALFAITSTAWSVFPAWTAYKAGEYFIDVALLAAILVELRSLSDLKSLYDCTWVLLAFLLASVWLGVVLAPGEAVVRGIGVTGVQIYGVIPTLSANSVGDLGATLAIVSISRMLRPNSAKRSMYAVLMCLSLLTLACSQTRSALTGFIAASLVMLLVARRIGMFSFASLGAVYLLLLSNAGALFQAYFVRDQSTEMFMSLSGRVTWWEFAWQKYLERPLIGFGAYAGGRFASMAEFGSGMTSSLHNTYMEVLLGSGPIGVFLIVTLVLWLWFGLARRFVRFRPETLEAQMAVESAGVFTMVTVLSLFSTSIIWHGSQDFMLVLAFVEFLRRCSHTPRCNT